MNDKVGKLVERVRLTDEDLKTWAMGIPILDAQIRKVLNDPDLALIDRGNREPYDIFQDLFNEYSVIGCCRGAVNQWPSEYQDEFWGELANRLNKTIIPLAEAMKEVNNG